MKIEIYYTDLHDKTSSMSKEFNLYSYADYVVELEKLLSLFKTFLLVIGFDREVVDKITVIW